MRSLELAVAMMAALACHRPARHPDTSLPPVPTSSAPEDTARGIVAVVGTDRFLHVVLKQSSGARGVTLVGEETRAMSSVAGADVWVTGTRLANGDLQVSRFIVRSVDGVAATDGTLELSGSQYYIVTADGARHVVNNVPDVLRQNVGKRVWATGQLAQGPATFGVIEAPKSTR